MTFFDTLSEKTHQNFEARHQVRENALNQTRALTRCSANAIRAIHRGEKDIAEEAMRSGRTIVEDLKQSVKPYPEIYFSGYTQDALKEYVEARLTIDVISNQPLPMPEELGVEYATYIRGLAEIIGELRRRCLDILRQGYSDEAERLLTFMDDIYAILVTLDYPDAITDGLRRQTDLVRGIIERTRADLTLSLREQRLQQSLQDFETRFNGHAKG
ncbi:MAG: haloacid dehalogenase [Anaerolineae bacterium]|jgi:translin|nr:haloacid dehalogenase [Anaerolineae bacterium]